MSKPKVATQHSPVGYQSYIAGFVLSVLATLMAYFFVVNDLFTKDILIAIVLFIAVIQLIIQLIFFLHLGRGGNSWRWVTFLFAGLIVLIVVIGSMWIMYNLDYNMMTMTPAEMDEYMRTHEGL